jgi:hypothetical protein
VDLAGTADVKEGLTSAVTPVRPADTTACSIVTVRAAVIVIAVVSLSLDGLGQGRTDAANCAPCIDQSSALRLVLSCCATTYPGTPLSCDLEE